VILGCGNYSTDKRYPLRTLEQTSWKTKVAMVKI
jgi:hypothetical protein